MTFTARLSFTSATASFAHEDAMNGEIFQPYVEHVRVPTVSRCYIIVLDNMPAPRIPGR